MSLITVSKYDDITLKNIVAESPEVWETSDATHVRVSLPSEIGNMLAMQDMGYQYVDRMLDVTIGLKRINTDLQKSIRLQPVLISDRKEEIKELAVRSFVRDRRFHVEPEYCPEVARKIICGWVDEIPEFYVCIYKEQIIGFLALKEVEDKKSSAIYLAAVDEKYRASGAAMSLYANAILVGLEKGYQSITGYISSSNTAVMNLYAHLGGTFSNPQDIYVKNFQK